MVECVQHPDGSGKWVPVADLLTELYTEAQATGLVQEQQAEEFASLSARTARLEADVEKGEAWMSTLEQDNAALTERVAALTARVAAMETGPASGVDVSGHQTLAQVQAAAADPANRFVLVKATEGEGWKSPEYAAQVDAVRAAGKVAGAYHFAWCNQDPAKEAANFLASKPRIGEVVALDLERETAGETWTVRVAYALAWLDAVAAATGARPLVYANWSWIKGLRTAATAAQWARLTAYPLWLAEWTGVPGKHSTVTSKDGTNPDSWPIVAHQYGVVDGLDRNWTHDLRALKACAVTKEP